MRSGFFTLGILIAAGGIITTQLVIDRWDQFEFELPGMPEALTNLAGDASSSEAAIDSTTIYKWRDSAGNWQFGDTPPEQGAYEISQVQGVQSVKMHTPSPVSSDNTASTSELPQDITPLTPFTEPEKVQKLIEQARGVDQLMEDRKKMIDQQL